MYLVSEKLSFPDCVVVAIYASVQMLPTIFKIAAFAHRRKMPVCPDRF